MFIFICEKYILKYNPDFAGKVPFYYDRDMDFSIDDHRRTMRCHVNIVLANKFKAGIYIDVQDVKMSRLNIKEIITQKMDGLLEMAMRGSLNGYTISKIRVVEAC